MNVKQFIMKMINNNRADGFVLEGVKPWYDYDKINHKWTDKVLGLVYYCTLERFNEKIKVKVKGQFEPIIQQEDIDLVKQQGNKVLVDFDNLEAMPYKFDYNMGISFKASNVHLKEEIEEDVKIDFGAQKEVK